MGWSTVWLLVARRKAYSPSWMMRVTVRCKWLSHDFLGFRSEPTGLSVREGAHMPQGEDNPSAAAAGRVRTSGPAENAVPAPVVPAFRSAQLQRRMER